MNHWDNKELPTSRLQNLTVESEDEGNCDFGKPITNTVTIDVLQCQGDKSTHEQLQEIGHSEADGLSNSRVLSSLEYELSKKSIAWEDWKRMFASQNFVILDHPEQKLPSSWSSRSGLKGKLSNQEYIDDRGISYAEMVLVGKGSFGYALSATTQTGDTSAGSKSGAMVPQKIALKVDMEHAFVQWEAFIHLLVR